MWCFFQAKGLVRTAILLFLFWLCTELKGELLDANLFKVVSDIEVPADYNDVISTCDCKYKSFSEKAAKSMKKCDHLHYFLFFKMYIKI